MSLAFADADWVERYEAVCAGGAVGLLQQMMTHNVTVETSLGRVYGRADLTATLAGEQAGLRVTGVTGTGAFCGRADSRSAIVVSLDLAVDHIGASAIFGAPTGGSATLSSTLFGLVHGTRVYHAWRVVDYAAAARGLGLDPAVRAGSLAADAPKRGGIPWEFGEVRAGRAQAAPAHSDPLPSGLSAGTARVVALQSAWNLRRPDLVSALYAAPHAASGGTSSASPGPDHPWSQVVRACPDAVLFLEDTAESVREGDASSVGVVWRWVGTHSGVGYGAPTGRRIHARGLSVLQVSGAGIVKERVVLDQLGVLRDLTIRGRVD